ncbi:hypothetical protein AB0A74_16165 [Saccharothrix sp. NPDC042600]|uniref:hypothetical protein n=1 Tax=Saccharothrix TaxID=2071 RepID=UPI0033F90748
MSRAIATVVAVAALSAGFLTGTSSIASAETDDRFVPGWLCVLEGGQVLTLPSNPPQFLCSGGDFGDHRTNADKGIPKWLCELGGGDILIQPSDPPQRTCTGGDYTEKPVDKDAAALPKWVCEEAGGVVIIMPSNPPQASCAGPDYDEWTVAV